MTVQEQISNACHKFTQQVLYIIGSSSLNNLCAAAGTNHTDDNPPTTRAQNTTTSTRRMRLAEMNKITVSCPVSGCEARGIRNKNNFCTEHANALSWDVKVQLRKDQKSKSRPAQVGQ